MHSMQRFVLLAAALVCFAGCPGVPNDTRGAFDYPVSGRSAPAVDGNSSVNTANNSGPQAGADPADLAFPECRAPSDSGTLELEVLRLVNRERAQRGLNTLTLNSRLTAQADAYACELIHYDFFAHVNPITGSHLADRAEQFGYDYKVVGENLAAGQGTPQKAMEDWLASPGHAANILSPEYKEIGISVRQGGDYGTYWVQEFGDPASITTAAGPPRP